MCSGTTHKSEFAELKRGSEWRPDSGLACTGAQMRLLRAQRAHTAYTGGASGKASMRGVSGATQSSPGLVGTWAGDLILVLTPESASKTLHAWDSGRGEKRVRKAERGAERSVAS